MGNECSGRCERTEEQVKASGSTLRHECDDDGWIGARCPARHNGECFAYLCDDCAEAGAERALSAYYGGSGPQTLDEQCAAAWKQKEGR